MSKSPAEDYIKTNIRRGIGGESWDRLSEYMVTLYEKGLIDMENKMDTLGHMVFKITPKGMEAVEKYKDWKKFFGYSNREEESAYP